MYFIECWKFAKGGKPSTDILDLLCRYFLFVWWTLNFLIFNGTSNEEPDIWLIFLEKVVIYEFAFTHGSNWLDLSSGCYFWMVCHGPFHSFLNPCHSGCMSVLSIYHHALLLTEGKPFSGKAEEHSGFRHDSETRWAGIQILALSLISYFLPLWLLASYSVWVSFLTYKMEIMKLKSCHND